MTGIGTTGKTSSRTDGTSTGDGSLDTGRPVSTRRCPTEFGPARPVVTGRHTGSVTGLFPSRKMNRLVAFESLLEADLVDLMEVDADVLSYHEQPETFSWRDTGGKRRRYTPDFLAEAAGRWIYREVKPRRRMQRDPTLGGRRDRIEAECAARGAAFEIWTEDEIRAQPRLSNVREILRAGRRVGDAEAEGCVLDRIARLGGCGPIGALEGRGTGARRLRVAILRLAAIQTLRIEIGTGIDDATLVRLGGRR